MADTYGKKEREKKKAQKKREKEQRKEERRAEGKQTEVIMYVDAFGNFTETKPENVEIDTDQIIELGASNKSEGREYKGSVKFIDEEKGFGFIKGSGKLGDLYFSQSDSKFPLSQGQRVVFDIERTEKGLRAKDIRILDK